jgi:hypothetical protein
VNHHPVEDLELTFTSSSIYLYIRHPLGAYPTHRLIVFAQQLSRFNGSLVAAGGLQISLSD